MISSSLLAAAALVAADCPAPNVRNVNRPIAAVQVGPNARPLAIEKAVKRFAKKGHFAVQETIPAPQGLMEFYTHLFRDDIRVSVFKARGEPINISAYPLCGCEAGQMMGLQAAADAAVADLRAELLRP